MNNTSKQPTGVIEVTNGHLDFCLLGVTPLLRPDILCSHNGNCVTFSLAKAAYLRTLTNKERIALKPRLRMSIRYANQDGPAYQLPRQFFIAYEDGDGRLVTAHQHCDTRRERLLTMAKAKTSASDIIDIIEVSHGYVEFCVLGKTPLVCNRMSQKATHELLLPRGRKTAAERSLTLKHNPIEEYRASPYVLSDNNSPTAIAIMATAFKGAMKTAALDLPGAKKAQIGRLVFVEGDMVPIYGVPQIFMAIVRSADMNRTPDVRTRAILPRWAAKIGVTYTQPLMRPQAVANLLAASGFTAGVGDGRPEKGAMNYGQFKIVDKENPEFLEVLHSGARAAQLAALQAPAAYDDETNDLLTWFDLELKNRQIRGVVDAPRKKAKDDGQEALPTGVRERWGLDAEGEEGEEGEEAEG
jgi:hypothetical protein